MTKGKQFKVSYTPKDEKEDAFLSIKFTTIELNEAIKILNFNKAAYIYDLKSEQIKA